jgi:hypothetical protein
VIKRTLIAIFLGIICFYFLFSLGVTLLGYPAAKSFQYILGWETFVFFFSTFASGFVSAWIAKRKEILISFLSFFISYTPWVYLQCNESRGTIWFHRRTIIDIVGPYLVLILVAILGGFVAKNLRQTRFKT